MQVKPLAQVTPAVVTAMEGLVRQLSPKAPLPTAELLNAIISTPGSFLVVAEDESGSIVGMTTLVVYATPSKRIAVLESVVVDQAVRGRGVGKQLVTTALELAEQAGARDVNLTSNPLREAANHLYQSLGFVRRDTNAYIYRFKR